MRNLGASDERTLQYLKEAIMKEKDLQQELSYSIAMLLTERDVNPDFISDEAIQFITGYMISALKWAVKSFDEQNFINSIYREHAYKAYLRDKGHDVRISTQEKIINLS